LSNGLEIRLSELMRTTLIAIAAVAAMFLHPQASHAYEEPWCALSGIGGGGSRKRIAVCEACNPNPRWRGTLPASGRTRPAVSVPPTR
jgi:hypothetical protein